MSGWWGRLLGRKSGQTLDSRALAEMLSRGAQSMAGVSVTEQSAMSVATVYACVAVLSESVAQLPCILYSGAGTDARERATGHRLYGLLKDAPNEWQTPFEFWEQGVTNVALVGNHYVLKGMVGPRSREEVAELFPLRRDRVRVKERASGGPYYVVSDGAGSEREFEPSAIMHIRYRALSGWEGLSPISYNRETIGTQLAAGHMMAASLKNGARIGGVLQHPKVLSDAAVKRIREQWEGMYTGAGNASKTPILEEGLTFKEASMSPADMQYIEQRKLTATDICAIFRVPPHMVANLERATHSNIEHSAIEFVTHTLGPWLQRIEARIKKDLLSPADRALYYPEFLTTSLLRGDSAARGQFYKELFATGALSTNDICRLENLPPVGPDGNTRYVPGNMMRLGRDAITQPAPAQKQE